VLVAGTAIGANGIAAAGRGARTLYNHYSEKNKNGDGTASPSNQDQDKSAQPPPAAGGGPKIGSADPAKAGNAFPQSVKEQARAESGGKCVFCGTKTGDAPGPTRSEIDHAIPKSRGGDNTINNAQNTCRTCNRTKGAKTTEEFLE
jgi:5-methylcytosine-specific restriction endonuclease McrA